MRYIYPFNGRTNNNNQIRYFGLSTIDSPRHTFWLFLDILSYILNQIFSYSSLV